MQRHAGSNASIMESKCKVDLGAVRRELGMSAAEAADRLGISRRALMVYEANSDEIPLSLMIQMSMLYDFDLYEISGIRERVDNEVMKLEDYYGILKSHAVYLVRHNVSYNQSKEDEYKRIMNELIKKSTVFNKARLLNIWNEDQ